MEYLSNDKKNDYKTCSESKLHHLSFQSTVTSTAIKSFYNIREMSWFNKFAVRKLIAFALLVCGIEAESSNENFLCTSEKHRPKFHFSPKSSWMNDPNGMVYYDGIYHLFYQHYPDGVVRILSLVSNLRKSDNLL